MSPTAAAVDEYDLAASICRESFYDFVREFWSEVAQEEPVWNWHIEELCLEAQKMAERVFRGEVKLYDLICNVPPGSTKSTIFSIMFPAWVWTRMPHARFICASHTQQLALDLANKSRNIIQSEKYVACFPEIKLRDDQNTKGYFANTRKGMRFSVGTGGSVIGMHANFIIVDDPLDPTAAASDEELKTANKFVTETLPTRKVDKRVTVTMLIMQRLHQNDPTGHWMDKRGEKIRHIRLPAEVADGVLPEAWATKYVDGLLDPVRLNREALAEAFEELHDHGYSCQFRQTPIPPGGGMFHVDELIKNSRPKGQVPRMRRVARYWDKAGTAGGGNFTVGVKMGEDYDGRYWLLDVIRGQWDAHNREVIIHRTARIDGRGVAVWVEQEPGSSGKEAALATIRRLAGYNVRADKVSGNKEERADPFAAQVNGGNVYMVLAVWNGKFLDELRFFPFSTYKDQADAAGGAFAQLTKPIIRAGAIR